MSLPPAERAALLRELDGLYRLAITAWREGQYAAEQALLERYLLGAEHLGDLEARIRGRYTLAWVMHLRGNNRAALLHFTWLTSVVMDPILGSQVSPPYLGSLAEAFGVVARLGMQLGELSPEQALTIVDEGLAWVARTGRPGLAALLRLERSDIYQVQANWDAARRDLGAALALYRRYPTWSSYSEDTYLIKLAELNSQPEVRAYAEAVAQAEEARSRGGLDASRELRVLLVLAHARPPLQDLPGALEAAREAVMLARGMDTPHALARAWGALMMTARHPAYLDEATHASAQAYLTARACHDLFRMGDWLIGAGRLRVTQGRVAAGLPPAEPPGPARATPTARRYLAGARRLLARAAALVARQLPPAPARVLQHNLTLATAEADTLAAALDGADAGV